MPHTIALILAGGTGSRFGSARPKQFTLVAGRTVLEHSIAAFEQSEEIDEIGESDASGGRRQRAPRLHPQRPARLSSRRRNAEKSCGERGKEHNFAAK